MKGRSPPMSTLASTDQQKTTEIWLNFIKNSDDKVLNMGCFSVDCSVRFGNSGREILGQRFLYQNSHLCSQQPRLRKVLLPA